MFSHNTDERCKKLRSSGEWRNEKFNIVWGQALVVLCLNGDSSEKFVPNYSAEL